MISVTEHSNDTRVVYFDDTGMITAITGRIDEDSIDSFAYFKLDDIVSFVDGTWKFTDYAVTRTINPLLFEIVKKKANIRQRNIKNQIHKIVNGSDTDIFVEVNEDTLTFKANQDLITRSGVRKNQSVSLGGTDHHPFFITHKDKPDFIISTVLISFSDLLSGEIITINYEHKYEVSIYTKKYFDTYSLRRTY